MVNLIECHTAPYCPIPGISYHIGLVPVRHLGAYWHYGIEPCTNITAKFYRYRVGYQNSEPWLTIFNINGLSRYLTIKQVYYWTWPDMTYLLNKLNILGRVSYLLNISGLGFKSSHYIYILIKFYKSIYVIYNWFRVASPR